jgi:hypothetical protein
MVQSLFKREWGGIAHDRSSTARASGQIGAGVFGGADLTASTGW